MDKSDAAHTRNKKIESDTQVAERLAFVEESILALLSNTKKTNSTFEDEIDLAELWNAIWKGKFFVISITFLFALAGVLFSFSQQNQYKASVLLAPAQADAGVGGLAAKFGGLAGLAGINLGGGGDNKSLLAQEVLKSRQFAAEFITKHGLLIPLMAAKGWNRESGDLILDKEIYDIETKRWVRIAKPPRKSEPTMWEAYEEFSKRFSINENKKSGYLAISFEFFSPVLAKQWVDWLVEDINLQIRLLDVAEAEQSIVFLEEKLHQTSYSEMQKVFFELIEEQTKTVMLAEVREEYVFKTVDPAVIPEEKSRPKRVLICVLSTVLGGMLAVLLVLIRYFSQKNDG